MGVFTSYEMRKGVTFQTPIIKFKIIFLYDYYEESYRNYYKGRISEAWGNRRFP